MLAQSPSTHSALVLPAMVETSALVIVPTYDEADNIVSLIERLRTTSRLSGVAFDVLVVDDGSPDGTAALVEELQVQHPNLHLLRRGEKSGLGGAYRAGFHWATERSYDVVIELDADHSHPVEMVPTLLATIAAGADLAIGSRYVHGGRTAGWSASRRALSRAGNWYVALALRIGVRDATAGFRAYRTDLLELVNAGESVSDGYGFQVEMTWRARRSGAEIVEVPITFTERSEGQSKMCARIAVEALARVTLTAVTRGRRGFRWGRGRSAD